MGEAPPKAVRKGEASSTNSRRSLAHRPQPYSQPSAPDAVVKPNQVSQETAGLRGNPWRLLLASDTILAVGAWVCLSTALGDRACCVAMCCVGTRSGHARAWSWEMKAGAPCGDAGRGLGGCKGWMLGTCHQPKPRVSGITLDWMNPNVALCPPPCACDYWAG